MLFYKHLIRVLSNSSFNIVIHCIYNPLTSISEFRQFKTNSSTPLIEIREKIEIPDSIEINEVNSRRFFPLESIRSTLNMHNATLTFKFTVN